MSEKSPRFGENFSIDKTNRLAPQPSEKNEIPEYAAEYIASSKEVRAMLKEAAEDPENEGWDVMPENIQGMEDIFDRARELVTEKWNEKVHEYLAEKCRGWAKQLQGNEKLTEQADLLNDPAKLEEKLRIRQFGVLEDIRGALPEAWRELVLISSERQMAEIEVVRKWVKGLPKDREGEIAEACEVKSVEELKIFIDTMGILGKYINQAYVKQIELADASGGKVKTKLAEQSESEGAKYLYDPEVEEGKVDIKPYAEVFPFEWKRIAKDMEHLAARIEKALDDEKLEKEKYKNLPAYLRKFSATYNSKTLNPDALYEEWQSLMRDMKDLALKDGCPIMLVPQGDTSVAGKATKVDAEIRFGFITKESRELVKTVQPFHEVAQELVTAQDSFLEKPRIVPPVIANIQPLASGPNMFWTTRGERGDEKIVSHNNAVIDVAVTGAYPALQRAFEAIPDEETFKQATVLDNVLHELGHNLAPNTDKKVKERIGTLSGKSSESKIAEELKADTGNMKILLETIRRGKTEVDPRKQLWAKLGDVCDYLKNKSSEPGTAGESYHFGGVAIMARLLEKGIVVEQEGKFTITDPIKGVEALAEINDELMDLYLKGKPEDLKSYVAIIREKKNDPRVQQFIKVLSGK